MDHDVCVDMIIGSEDIKAIGVPAEVLVSVWFHNSDIWNGFGRGYPNIQGRGGGGGMSLLKNAVVFIQEQLPIRL